MFIKIVFWALWKSSDVKELFSKFWLQRCMNGPLWEIFFSFLEMQQNTIESFWKCEWTLFKTQLVQFVVIYEESDWQ